MSRCPTDLQLESLLEERLNEHDTRKLSVHVDSCPRCQAALECLTETETSEPISVVLRATTRPPSAARLPADFLLGLRQNPPTQLPAGGAGDRTVFVEAPSAPTLDIPGYEVIREVGRGGMGVVYQARHLKLNRLVALKMIRTGLAGPKDLARFRQEAEAVARLQHPNIVQIFDVGESAGRPFLALEYVAGDSLVHYVASTPQPVYAAARLVETLARAVHVAHEHGIVHCDLKPANILLAPPGRDSAVPRPDQERHAADIGLVAKITDFGLARRLDQHSSTDTGEVVGTPSYMAPEQAGGPGVAVGPAADVYALGAILYEMLTGRPPFKGATALDTILQVRHQEPVRPSGLRPQLPVDLETIVLKCLEKEPAQRYASALALAEDLRCFRHGLPIKARAVTLPERAWKWARRRPVQAATVLGLIVVTLLGFAGVTWQWQEAAFARDRAVEEKREKEEQKDQADKARIAAELAQQQAAEQRKQARLSLYYSRIAQSELQWRVNDFHSAEATLAECLPSAGLVDRRGWEWYYLRGLFHGDLLTLTHQTSGLSGNVDVRADGKWVVSVQGGFAADERGKSSEVGIWDARTGALVSSWHLPPAFHRLALSPDGKRLALGGTDGAVLVRDTGTGKDVLHHQSHSDTVAAVAFSLDGAQLASAGWDGVISLRDVVKDEVTQTLRGHAGRVYLVAFHPDGRSLASAGEDGTVRLWDRQNADTLRVFRGHKSPVYSLAFSPDGSTLATAGSNGNLRLWETATGRVIQSVTGQAGAVLSVAFSPDGRYLAYGGGDTTVRVWDVEAGVERITFRGHAGPVDSVKFTPDGQRLVSGSAAQATVKVWDLTRHPEMGTLARTVADIEALAFRDGGRRLVSLTMSGKLQTWDAASGMVEEERSLATFEKALSSAVVSSFSNDGLRLAARARGGAGREVRVWDVASGAELASLKNHPGPVTCVRLSGDGKLAATACADLAQPGHVQVVKIWDAETGEDLGSQSAHSVLHTIAFSADGRFVAFEQLPGTLVVMDWANNRTAFQAPAHHGNIAALTFSPDGKRLASAGLEERTVKVWDWTTQDSKLVPAATLTLGVPSALLDLAFSPDSRRLAGITRDLVRLWDAESGQGVLTLRGAPQRHYDPDFNPRVLFSPDGRRLVGTNWDESISVWEADTLDSQRALERRQASRRRAADRRATFWHLEEAEHCLRSKNVNAARFHLQQLAGADLPEVLRPRRDRVRIQLDNAPAPDGD